MTRQGNRVHTSDKTIASGAPLAAETGVTRGEESRLKAGCSQDWLPHLVGGVDGADVVGVHQWVDR